MPNRLAPDPLNPTHDEDEDALSRDVEEAPYVEDPYIDTQSTLLEQWEPSPMVVGGQDEHGLPQIHVEQSNSDPPLSHVNMVCLGYGKGLRDPVERCRHLGGVVTEFQSGNIGLEKPLTRLHLLCKAMGMNGEQMDLTGARVFACMLRDPPCPCGHGEEMVIKAIEDRQTGLADRQDAIELVPEWAPPK